VAEGRYNLSQVEREEVLGDCFEDPVLFCKMFLHEHFYLNIPWVHRGLMAILTEKTKFLLKYGDLYKIVSNFVHEYEDGRVRQTFHVFENGRELKLEEIKALDESCQNGSPYEPGLSIKLDLGSYTLIEMPRGSSKTTIAGLAIPLWKLLYQEDKFTLYVSKADKHAQGQLESVRKQLANNELILEVFGDLKPRRSDEERWAKEKFETMTGVAMQARGKGSAIRGINHNNIRPSTILVDDPQAKADVKSETMREDDKKWAFAELTPARAQIIGSEGRMIALGTNLGPRSLVSVWEKDPKWTVVKLEVKDKDGDFIWPDYMNQEKYDAEKDSFAMAGLLSDFYLEYHNKEVVESELPFPLRFIYHEPPPPDTFMACATYADLATSEKRWADYSVVTTVGMTEKGMIYVLDCWMERTSSEERKVDEYFRQSLEWGSVFHGFESVAYQAVFGNSLREAMFRKSHYFEVIAVPHKTRKVDRIMGALRSRYAGGYVKHRVRFPLLEAQLYDFRTDDSHEHDDGPDAVAAAVTLLDPVAAFAAGQDPTEDSETDVEDEIGGDWRIAS
jgi:predicted phage terminase large subunit-like protein